MYRQDSVTKWGSLTKTSDIAMAWRDRGVAPIPLIFGTKIAAVPWLQWQNSMPPTALIEVWWRKQRNLGLIMSNGITVLDFDDVESYKSWYVANSGLRGTFTVQTSRGMHAYFQLEDGLNATVQMNGGEVKGNGYVVGPPSVHPTGKIYGIVNDTKIVRVTDISSLGIKIRQTPVANFDSGKSIRTPMANFGLIDSINARLDIVQMVNELTMLRPVGNCLLGLCPWHDDRNPSFAVWPASQTAYCFSPACPCHRRLDALDIWALTHNMDIYQAMEELAQ